MQVSNPAALEMGEVERDNAGLPRAWPLLKTGDNIVTRSAGMPVNVRLSRDDLAAIVDYSNAKGVQIPIDSEHVVSNLAGKLGIDEAELLKRLPRMAGVAGFGRLELRGDTLYLADAEYLDIGKEVLKAGQFRYFSPSLRGLDGKSPIRVTSVALTNTPHLQNVPALTAGETDDDDDDDMTPATVAAAIESITNKEAVTMPDDPTKTTGNPPETPPAADPKKEEKSTDGELMKLLKEVLGDDVTPENLKARLAALKTTGESSAELAEKVKQLECAEEARKLDTVRKEALAHGKLTPAMLQRKYFADMTSAELSDYCAAVADGCAAPVGNLEMAETRVVHDKKPDAPKHYATVGEAISAAPIHDMKGL